ncbi:MAG TPA: hypothetical protein VFY87_16070 [Geminicoccaceae bacterium]|jgi:hypothetical protein|nr:hypothetical protein [Geminicoccaceae bacterium]
MVPSPLSYRDVSRRTVQLVRRGEALGADREAVRALGRAAHERGGIDGMRVVFEDVRRSLDTWDQPHLRELEAAWDGIGGWAAPPPA